MLPPLYALLSNDAAVKAIVGDRIYPHGEAPQDTTRPYVTWFLVSWTPENNLTDLPPSDRATVQVDAWHQTSAGVVSLMTAIRDAIEPTAHVTGIVVNMREPDTRLYRLALQADFILTR